MLPACPRQRSLPNLATSSGGASTFRILPPIAWADQFLISVWKSRPDPSGQTTSTHLSRRGPFRLPVVGGGPGRILTSALRVHSRQCFSRPTPRSSPATATIAVACPRLLPGFSSKNSNSPFTLILSRPSISMLTQTFLLENWTRQLRGGTAAAGIPRAEDTTFATLRKRLIPLLRLPSASVLRDAVELLEAGLPRSHSSQIVQANSPR